MNVAHFRLSVAVTVALMIALYARAEEPSPPKVQITGDVRTPLEFEVSAFKTKFAGDLQKVKYTSKGQVHEATCVPLLKVLEAAGVETAIKMDPKLDPKTKHRPLRLAIQVEARDGYGVVLSLAEILPMAGNHPAYLALDEDGAALPGALAPAKLIVPDDATPARAVRGVVAIRVVDLASKAATTRPGAGPTTAKAEAAEGPFGIEGKGVDHRFVKRMYGVRGLNNIPALEAVSVTPGVNFGKRRFEAADVEGVLQRATPVEPEDRLLDAWSYAPFASAKFEISGRSWRAEFFLGGLGFLTDPEGRTAAFLCALEEAPGEGRFRDRYRD